MSRKIRGLAGAALLLLLAAGGLSGCSTAGAKFDTTNVNKIVRGTTSKAEVRTLFGNPLRVESGFAGEVWTYTYVDTQETGPGVIGHVLVGVEQTNTATEMLVVDFAGDVVKDFQYTSGSSTDTYHH